MAFAFFRFASAQPESPRPTENHKINSQKTARPVLLSDPLRIIIRPDNACIIISYAYRCACVLFLRFCGPVSHDTFGILPHPIQHKLCRPTQADLLPRPWFLALPSVASPLRDRPCGTCA